jgi:hypothetical protein
VGQFEICQAELVEAGLVLYMLHAFDKLRLTGICKFKKTHYRQFGDLAMGFFKSGSCFFINVCGGIRIER